jgi:hypothetical protein
MKKEPNQIERKWEFLTRGLKTLKADNNIIEVAKGVNNMLLDYYDNPNTSNWIKDYEIYKNSPITYKLLSDVLGESDYCRPCVESHICSKCPFHDGGYVCCEEFRIVNDYIEKRIGK